MSERAPMFAPKAIARIRARRDAIAARIASGETSPADAERELRDFKILMIAHVVEHGPEDA